MTAPEEEKTAASQGKLSFWPQGKPSSIQMNFGWSAAQRRGTKKKGTQSVPFFLEQVKGVEPSYQAWEACVLPMNYTCVWNFLSIAWLEEKCKGEVLAKCVQCKGVIIGAVSFVSSG